MEIGEERKEKRKERLKKREEKRETKEQDISLRKDYRYYRHSRKLVKVFPILLVLVGVIFLLDNTNIINNAWGKLWPLILITIGVVHIINYFYESKKS